jgi:hypothetical protein
MILTFGDTTQPGAVAAKIAIARARTVVFRNNCANTIYWGWEPTTNAKLDGNPQVGVRLKTDEWVVIDGKDMLATNIYFASAAGGNVIEYTLNT